MRIQRAQRPPFLPNLPPEIRKHNENKLASIWVGNGDARSGGLGSGQQA